MKDQYSLPGFLKASDQGFTRTAHAVTIEQKRKRILNTIDKHLNGRRLTKQGTVQMEDTDANGKVMSVCVPYGATRLNIFQDENKKNVPFATFNLEDVTRKVIWGSIKEYIDEGFADDEIKRVAELWRRRKKA